MVVDVAASADGSTFGALLGDGKVLIWDGTGSLKRTLQVKGEAGQLSLSSDGRFAAAGDGWLLGYGAPQGGVILEIATGKLLQTWPSGAGSHGFSPTEPVLAIGDGDSIQFLSPSDGTSSGSIATPDGASLVTYSPNGRMLAVLTDSSNVQIYETSTGKLLKEFGDEGNGTTALYSAPAWAPDSSTLTALRIASIKAVGAQVTTDHSPSLEKWQLTTGRLEVVAVQENGFLETLDSLPGGRALVIGGDSGLVLLDPATLKPLPKLSTTPLSTLAAGLKGDTFLTAGSDGVHLWDVATLEPRQQLFAAPPPSPIWPAAVGIGVWSLVFGLYRARRLRRPCQTCGQPFQPNGRKDTNVDCPVCRQKVAAKRLAPAEAARQQRSLQRRGWVVLLTVDGMLAALVALAAGEGFGFFWPFVTTAVLLPALLVGFLLFRVKWKLWRAADPARDFAQADAAAGSPGATGQVGQMLVWTAQGTSLGDLLGNEAEVARQRLASTLGRSVPVPTARALFFPDGDAAARYMRALGVHVATRWLEKSFYWRAPSRRMVVVERPVREKAPSPRAKLRSLVVYHLLEAVDGRAPAAWIEQGLIAALSDDDEHHELARLNRRVLAGVAAGRTIGATEFFGATVNQVWKKHGRHTSPQHFAWSHQFAAQAWSVMEFICGRGATPERREAFQGFFNDADRRKRPAQAIERHFGCSCDELLASWRGRVDGQGVGEHFPPPEHVAEHLLAGPIARLASPETLPGERVSAIRELGEQGYLLGADRLIAVLRDENEEVCAEATWALECISGQVLGSSPAVWEKWWEGLNTAGRRTASVRV
jgi:DNA-directed RNA polymerase subunit RPC12/RpoP